MVDIADQCLPPGCLPQHGDCGYFLISPVEQLAKQRQTMADVTIGANSPDDDPPVKRGLSVVAALLVAVAGAVVAGGATVILMRKVFGSGVDALLVAIALMAFGATAYGLLMAALAVVDTAGDRRRQDRVVSERRQGDRAREPRKR